MHDEFELKLALTPEQLDKLARHPLLRSLRRERKAPSRLVSTYFDTPAGQLRERAMALRVRRDGETRTQTLKVKGNGASGLQHFREYEAQINGNEPDLGLIDDPDLKSMFETNGLAAEITPVFTTEFDRRRYLLHLADSEIELALDRGEIHTGTKSMPICEAELELVSGRPSRIYELALVLQDSIAFRLESRTKARRGYDLALNREPEPVRATDPNLAPSMSVAEAFAAIARTCSEQIRSNEGAVLAGVDPEGVHQMRVGIRRLRAAVQTFREHLAPEAYAFLKEELSWMQTELGPARDWDVFLVETLPSVEKRLDEERTFEALRVAAERARRMAYERAHGFLADPRYARLLLRLNLGLEEGSLFAHVAGAPIGPMTRSVGDFAAEVLSGRDKKLRKRGRNHARLSTDQLHKVRIEAKKVRYGVEFFRRLYPAKTVKPYVKSVAAIQDALGSLNDAAVTRHLLEELRLTSASFESYSKPLTERAVGIVLGWQAARLEDGLRAFHDVWDTYAKADRFWT